MSRLRKPVDETDHQTGRPSASVTLVEYGDYQCSHCGAAHPIIKKLLKDQGGDLLFVFRNFPLQESHPNAMIAAQAAEAAALQDKFWEMHDLIYEHQDELDKDNLIYFAETLDLNISKFTNDMNSQNVISKIENDFESGVRSGVNGTPTFFINDQRVDSYDETYESLADAVRDAE
jgi:protein-disulfide isomerase